MLRCDYFVDKSNQYPWVVWLLLWLLLLLVVVDVFCGCENKKNCPFFAFGLLFHQLNVLEMAAPTLSLITLHVRTQDDRMFLSLAFPNRMFLTKRRIE